MFDWREWSWKPWKYARNDIPHNLLTKQFVVPFWTKQNIQPQILLAQLISVSSRTLATYTLAWPPPNWISTVSNFGRELLSLRLNLRIVLGRHHHQAHPRVMCHQRQQSLMMVDVLIRSLGRKFRRPTIYWKHTRSAQRTVTRLSPTLLEEWENKKSRSSPDALVFQQWEKVVHASRILSFELMLIAVVLTVTSTELEPERATQPSRSTRYALPAADKAMLTEARAPLRRSARIAEIAQRRERDTLSLEKALQPSRGRPGKPRRRPTKEGHRKETKSGGKLAKPRGRPRKRPAQSWRSLDTVLE